MNEHLTDIILVIDYSSSMQPMQNPTVDSVNAFIKSQNHVPGRARFTLIRFREGVEDVLVGQNFNDASLLDKNTFYPIGAKVRLDAIGHSIKDTARRIAATAPGEQPAHVIFIIFTHGEEAPSHAFTIFHLRDLIRFYRQEPAWQFFYVACDSHAMKTAVALGVKEECRAEIEFSPLWIAASWRAISRKVRLTRLKSISQMDAQALRDQNRDLGQLIVEEEEWWSCRNHPEQATAASPQDTHPLRSPMQRGYTEIIYLLDRSGSMGSMQEPAIAAFNDFVRSQQELPGGALLTLVQFGSDHETSIPALPIWEIQPLTSAGYSPRGTTALLDAIGCTIDDVDLRLKGLPEAESPGKVIFAIFTDGLENASIRHTTSHVSDLIDLYRSLKGWEFIFLAANQDAIASACALRMNRTFSGNVEFSAKGIRSSSHALHRKIRSMRLKSEGVMDEQAEADDAKSMEEIIREEDQWGSWDSPENHSGDPA